MTNWAGYRREWMVQKRAEWKALGLCTQCGKKPARDGRVRCEACDVATFTVRNLTDLDLPLEEGRTLPAGGVTTFERKLRDAGPLAATLNELRAAGSVEISVELADLNLEGL